MNEKKPQLNPMLKIVLDLGPLVLFFVANSRPALFLPLVAPILPADLATGERAGIWKIAAPSLIREVCAASQASTVAASEPYASAAQTESNPAASASWTSWS